MGFARSKLFTNRIKRCIKLVEVLLSFFHSFQSQRPLERRERPHTKKLNAFALFQSFFCSRINIQRVFFFNDTARKKSERGWKLYHKMGCRRVSRCRCWSRGASKAPGARILARIRMTQQFLVESSPAWMWRLREMVSQDSRNLILQIK